MPVPLLLLLGAQPALVAPSPANDVQAIFEAARAKAKAVAEARAAHLKAGKNSKDFKADCAAELASLDSRLGIETRPEVRQALLVSKLYHLQMARAEVPDTFLAQVHREVPPLSPAWSLETDLIQRLADESAPGWGPYVAEARARHPDPAIRRNLHFEYFWDRLDAKDEAAWKPSYERLQSEFADSRQAKQAKEILEAEQKTGIGRPAPAFSLPALGAPGTTYTLDTFKGRWLLIDFWATWCPPCRAEMPSLHAAWAKFQGKPFDILSLSFDRKVEHIAPFRQQAATPMPWKHAFVEGGFKAPVAEAYGVKGIPKPLLIAPDGKIAASGGQLRGKNLEQTLAKLLGN